MTDITKYSKIWIFLTGIAILLVLFVFIQSKTENLVTGFAVGGYGPVPITRPEPIPPGCFITGEIPIPAPECTSENEEVTELTLLIWNAEGCEPQVREETRICGDDLVRSFEGMPEMEFNTNLEFPCSFSTRMLETGDLTIALTNNGEDTIENIEIKVDTPPESESFPSFISKISRWQNSDITGFAAASQINSRLLEWETSPSQKYDELKPNETIKTNFKIDVPLTDSKQKDINLIVSSNGYSLYNKIIKSYIDIPQFLLIPDIQEENILDVYMFIFNIAKEDKKFNIEFNIDEYGLLPKTVLVEYFGPYSIKANDIKIAAYKFRYDDYFEESDYLLRAILYEKDQKLGEYNYKLNIRDLLTEPLLEKPAVLIEDKLNSLLILILVIVLSIIFIITYKYYSKDKKPVKNIKSYIIELNKFLKEAVKKGYAKKEIQKLLEKNGWPKKIITEYCDKAFKEIEEKIGFKK